VDAVILFSVNECVCDVQWEKAKMPKRMSSCFLTAMAITRQMGMPGEKKITRI